MKLPKFSGKVDSEQDGSLALALTEPPTKNSNLIQDVDIGTITVLPSNSSIGHVDKTVGLTLGNTLGA